MLKLILFFIVTVATTVVLIRLIEARSIFFPMKGEPAAAVRAIGYEDAVFVTADGKKLHGWFVPSSASKTQAPVMLFLHGNAGNIGHRWEKIHILHDLDVSVFIFDYRGYGRSEGTPSEAGMYKDADAAYAYLAARGATSDRIILYGESIGGAFAVDLAARHPVKALILEGTFTSIPAMVRRSMPFIPAFALATRLDSLSKISKARVPKLIFHSLDDEIVPIAMGQELFAAAGEPKKFIQLRGGHNSAFLEDADTYRAALARFLASR